MSRNGPVCSITPDDGGNPETRNPKPETRNRKPKTRNPIIRWGYEADRAKASCWAISPRTRICSSELIFDARCTRARIQSSVPTSIYIDICTCSCTHTLYKIPQTPVAIVQSGLSKPSSHSKESPRILTVEPYYQQNLVIDSQIHDWSNVCVGGIRSIRSCGLGFSIQHP